MLMFGIVIDALIILVMTQNLGSITKIFRSNISILS